MLVASHDIDAVGIIIRENIYGYVRLQRVEAGEERSGGEIGISFTCDDDSGSSF